MSKVVLKTTNRKTTVNRTAVRNAVAHAYAGTSSVKSRNGASRGKKDAVRVTVKKAH
jgi:hypothetical protein